jgi:Flp pilus assembly protein TadG
MKQRNLHRKQGGGMRGFLRALKNDVAGNTFMIIAFSLVPLMAVAGSGVDMSRMYMAQSRLQQACDSGALAARRVMLTSSLTTSDEAEGVKYFNFNFPNAAYGTKSGSTTIDYGNIMAGSPAAATGAISGVARTTIPMTIMRITGRGDTEIEATCSSKLEVGNIDVMMVLDTTGSMTASIASGTGGPATTRIAALRVAVRDFYDALGPGTVRGRVRYGFVTYGRTVNVGTALKNADLMDSVIGGNPGESWTYQTRRYWYYANVPNTTVICYRRYNNATCHATLAAAQASSGNNISSSNCTKFQSNTSFSGFTGGTNPGKTYNTGAMTTTRITYAAGSYSTNNCVRIQTTRVHNAYFTSGSGRTLDDDIYDQHLTPVSAYVATLGTSSTVTNLSDGSTNRWNGCVEERGSDNTITSTTDVYSLPTGH